MAHLSTGRPGAGERGPGGERLEGAVAAEMDGEWMDLVVGKRMVMSNGQVVDEWLSDWFRWLVDG